jgi:Transposase DDE domain group 1
MADLAGEADGGALRLDFDRRLVLRFRGSVITSDGGLLAYRELDDALALTSERWREIGRDTHRQEPTASVVLRQSVFGRLAGYEDVNDPERLCRDPAMRW